LIFIFGFSNVKTIRIALNVNRKVFSDQCYLSLKIRPYFVSIFSTYTLAALHYAGNVRVEGVKIKILKSVALNKPENPNHMPHVFDNTVKKSASYRRRPCRQEREIQTYADGIQNVK